MIRPNLRIPGSRTVRLLCGLGLISLSTACYYGPPEDDALIKHVVALPGAEQVAVGVLYSKLQHPRGLATFPNGGVARPVERKVLLHVADEEPGPTRVLARIPVPEPLKFGTNLWIEGWSSGVIFLRVSGCKANECWGDLRMTQHYRIEVSGDVAAVKADARLVAMPLLPRSQSGERFLQVSHAFGVVQIMTEPNGTYRSAYRLLQSGMLEMVSDAPDPETSP